MAKVVGDIAVQVGADVSGLQAGMRRAGSAVDGFDAKAAKMAKNFAKVGVGVAAAAAAITVAGVKMAQSAGDAAREIQNLSDVSGIGVEKFQRYAAAAQTVGFEQEKLADIFKDVNDKFGDFMATGAGPLADFFENIAPAIGVTAEQFAKLSGPDALQLYVTSLERAGLSQQQMTFYMEALASDATALLPLLKNNGTEMRRLGNEAQRSGRILSSDMVQGGVEVDRKLQELSSTITTTFNAAILENSDEIIALADTIMEDWIPALIAVAGFIADVVGAVADMVSAISAGITKIAEFVAAQQNMAAMSSKSRRDIRNGVVPEEPLADMSVGPSGRARVTGVGSPVVPAPVALPGISITRPSGGGGGSSSGGGGGGWSYSGPTREDLEALQERFLEENEIVQKQYEESLEKLREYREAKLGTEEEFNALEADIKAKHEKDLAEIERKEREVRLQAVSGMFGDLASLMQSENKKMFAIGKAAAIAEASISGYKAAVSAWEKGMDIGGPGVAETFTALSLAKTGTLISRIASQQATGSSSGGGGGGGSAATTAATTAAAGPLQVRVTDVVGAIPGGSLVSWDDVGPLLMALQEEAGANGIQFVGSA